MSNLKKEIELLAPARNLEAGMAAINCGADALYIGAEAFSARDDAGNSIEDIERLAEYAHRYYGRLYVALNTLIYDKELSKAEKLIHRLYEAGADALIIQDMGLLELDLPPIPLFASTQTHNTTPEKVRFLEEVGFQRVILARELSLDTIAAIRKETTVALESFVHGALCVCYSGRCSMSYAIGGRSGNRGRCAQPCRKRYRLFDDNGNVLSEEGYLLSLKDMNRSASLSELIDAGISSLKIEGRLKDIPYVVNVVSHYRQRLDNILEERKLSPASSGRAIIDFKPNPDKTFNRGYTDYLLKGDPRGIASPLTPKSMGEKIGRVRSLAKDHFVLEKAKGLANGDGLCFFDGQKVLRGMTVNGVDGKKVFPRKMDHVSKGSLIYRNYDHAFTKLLRSIPCRRDIPLSMNLLETAKGIELRARDDWGNSVSCSMEVQKEAARNLLQAEEALKKQISRLGDTPFVLDELLIDLSEPLFIPPSILNTLRRNLVEKMLKEREKNRSRSEALLIKNNFPYPEKGLSYLDNALNEKAVTFYRRHGVENIQAAAESGLDMAGKKVMTTKLCIRRELGMCIKDKDAVSLSEPLYIEDEEGRRFGLRFDCAACEMEIYMADCAH